MTNSGALVLVGVVLALVALGGTWRVLTTSRGDALARSALEDRSFGLVLGLVAFLGAALVGVGYHRASQWRLVSSSPAFRVGVVLLAGAVSVDAHLRLVAAAADFRSLDLSVERDGPLAAYRRSEARFAAWSRVVAARYNRVPFEFFALVVLAPLGLAALEVPFAFGIAASLYAVTMGFASTGIRGPPGMGERVATELERRG